MATQRSFFARLTDRAEAADSLLCVGLDPHPEFLDTRSAAGARDFCLRLIEATAKSACAFKPNNAFFEAFGAPGWAALGDVIAGVPEDIPVILDAKRGDIALTSGFYAQAAFDSLGADAMTVSPYLGGDSIEPFVQDSSRGIFLLCKTSNPGSADIQELGEDGEPIFLHVARKAARWNEKDNIGLVVGATDPAAIYKVRNVAPTLWILAPGVGPQGADPKAALEAGLRPDGLGILLSVSRSISTASAPEEAAARFRDGVNHLRESSTLSLRRTSAPAPTGEPNLADALLDTGCVKFGDFRLKSGERSPIYFDLRLLSGFPDLLSQVADAYAPILEQLAFDRLAAVPYAGLPIATAIALQAGYPLAYPRKEVKSYGTGQFVEGGIEPGETAVLIDDLATTGASKFEAAERLAAAGLQVSDVVVLIDREGGARESLAEAGLSLHSVFTLSRLIEYWSASSALDGELLAKLEEYLAR
ncbi:MAG: orotidine-5'-phosphate decarboxylase [Anaerolineales bacterium]